MKRSDYISWDEYFMGVALLAAKRSKDPSTQVGACIVDQNNVILTTGYNGFPIGCSDDEFPWEREGEITKYPYVVHAELNAILNASGKSLRDARIYVALFPCNECAKAIIQSGIREVVYLSDKYADTEATKASKMMFTSAGVKLTHFKPEIDTITLDFRVDR
ncbi:MAG: dCMP deaminase family protein [Clostridiales bacterium]|nr:dCMP deaminase family protein [Clostridiales bacterium]